MQPTPSTSTSYVIVAQQRTRHAIGCSRSVILQLIGQNALLTIKMKRSKESGAYFRKKRKAREEEERKDEGSLFRYLSRPQQQHEAGTSAEPEGDDAKETRFEKETDFEGKTNITLHARQLYCFTLEVPTSAYHGYCRAKST